jgi:hypothetical protein
LQALYDLESAKDRLGDRLEKVTPVIDCIEEYGG